jgi:hypothetical protein
MRNQAREAQGNMCEGFVRGTEANSTQVVNPIGRASCPGTLVAVIPITELELGLACI